MLLEDNQDINLFLGVVFAGTNVRTLATGQHR